MHRLAACGNAEQRYPSALSRCPISFETWNYFGNINKFFRFRTASSAGRKAGGEGLPQSSIRCRSKRDDDIHSQRQREGLQFVALPFTSRSIDTGDVNLSASEGRKPHHSWLDSQELIPASLGSFAPPSSPDPPEPPDPVVSACCRILPIWSDSRFRFSLLL